MTLCILCGQETRHSLTVGFIFSFKPIPRTIKCEKCTHLLISLKDHPTCPTCYRLQENQEFCEDCIRWKEMYPVYDFSHQALYAYNDPVKEWLEQYKFKGDVRLTSAFSQELTEAVRPFVKNNYRLVPIPISEEGLEKRGFNQVEELLRAANLSFYSCLSKKEQVKSQSQKNRKERMESSQLFYLSKEQIKNVDNQKILLVDDVYTTGRTLFHAADLLFENGASDVKTFSIAR